MISLFYYHGLLKYGTPVLLTMSINIPYNTTGTKRLAVFRPGTGVWFIKGKGYDDWAESTGNIAIQCGIKGDYPVAGDYEGNKKVSFHLETLQYSVVLREITL